MNDEVSPQSSPASLPSERQGQTEDATLRKIVAALTELTSILEQRPSPQQNALQDVYMLGRVQKYMDYYRRQHLKDQAVFLADAYDFPGRAELVEAWEAIASDIKDRIYQGIRAADRHGRRIAPKFGELAQYLIGAIPASLRLNPKPIHTVVQLYTPKMLFAAAPVDAVDPPSVTQSSNRQTLERDVQHLVVFLKACKAEAMSRLSDYALPPAKAKPVLNATMRKAAEFILKCYEHDRKPLAAEIADFIGLSEGRTRNEYIRVLKRNYGLTNKDGYFFSPDSKIREILASRDIA